MGYPGVEWRVTDLAKVLGRSRVTVSRLLSKSVNARAIKGIAAALDLKVGWCVNPVGPPVMPNGDPWIPNEQPWIRCKIRNPHSLLAIQAFRKIIGPRLMKEYDPREAAFGVIRLAQQLDPEALFELANEYDR